jgi:hypothetical protein
VYLIGGRNDLKFDECPRNLAGCCVSVFMAVYCQKFKDAAPDLIKYMDTIRNMLKQKGYWYQYDIEFRRSKLQLQISWGNMHHHILLTHMLANRQDNVHMQY